MENDIVIFDIIGSGFLRYMVRMMVGTLIHIGENKISLEEITTRLDKKKINHVLIKHLQKAYI